MNDKSPLDSKDLRILDELHKDARISWSDLGKRIGLSQPATADRVKRLQDQGIIEGYQVRINRKAIGLGVTVFIRLNTTHSRIAVCKKFFEDNDNIVEYYRVTGEDCFIAKVLVSDPSDLTPIVDAVAEHGSVHTSLVLEGVKNDFIPSVLISKSQCKSQRK